MSQGTEGHLEHAEHAQHAAHDPFDRRVAMTMTIVAAVLACVTMLGHRAHNDTLRLLNEQNELQIEANISHTQATDKWGEFQANNTRQHELKDRLRLLPINTHQPGSEAELKEVQREGLEKLNNYEKKLPKLEKEARDLEDKGKTFQDKAKEKLDESKHAHHRGDRFDVAELGVELALVLCSIAVLTKQRGFWFAGITVGVVGAAGVLWGLLS